MEAHQEPEYVATYLVKHRYLADNGLMPTMGLFPGNDQVEFNTGEKLDGPWTFAIDILNVSGR